MRILCSNDDGIHSPGLAALEDIARTLSDDVWTVAPEIDQSGMSRSITLTRPLRIRKEGDQRFAVDGTPTDCVQLAVGHLLDRRPDLVLSGVNNGHNLAEDVSFSGTIAVALHGMTYKIPSVAFSQARMDRNKPRWDTARAWGPKVLKRLLDVGWPDDVVMNVNFPNRGPEEVGGVAVCHQGRRANVELYAEERTDLRQRRYYWFGFQGTPEEPPAGTDLRAIYDGLVAVTPLHLAFTHEPTMPALEKALDDLAE
ncbi:acid phosphatase [Parvularcula bermudensis HTCC2503]|uniref:5'-nucleotidase SurE n=1 Tax=Parvularcula bermudensis (strain ATCC BAA-594 / HTCC2503 / KCTC 12087) TaxID=314260 RepID=E0TB93_PARBH|nr:5'/3'-nucleotidase SurE [Parvularcula bermudensis]ADM08297.1 acid phosphatase [Parvularcula bermudensis HTCC2503]